MKTKTNITELVFVIDRSGSMGGLESDTIGGVNSVLAKNREVDGVAFVTTILFDHQIAYLHDHVELSQVANLTRKDYQVRGCTALLDAVGEAIEHTKKVQHYLPKTHRAGHVVVTIITDGLAARQGLGVHLPGRQHRRGGRGPAHGHQPGDGDPLRFRRRRHRRGIRGRGLRKRGHEEVRQHPPRLG